MRQFDSVWVDALVRANRLTPFQAQEINAGRGGELEVGPYLLCEKIAGPPYVENYRARHRESGEVVRLAVERRTGFQPVDNSPSEALTGDRGFVEKYMGQVGNLSYIAPWLEGRTASEWLLRGGRFSPEVVREIAREIAAELAALEKSGQCHGDVSPWNLLITPSGETKLLHAGLRTKLRPVEGFAFAELPPEAYDYLSPERIAAGVKADMSSDIYACGCALWHLLCGRPPFRGGDGLAKLRAAVQGEIPDVRQLAPETPPALAEAIAKCVQKELNRRFESAARLAAALGEPTKEGRQFVARSLASSFRARRRGNSRLREKWASQNWPVRIAAIVACVAVVLFLLSPVLPRGTGFQPVVKTEKRDKPNLLKEKNVRPIARQVGNLSHVNRDPQIKPAGYVSTEKPRAAKRPVLDDFLLNADSPQSLETLSLKRGQRAIGKSGRRAVVFVPPGGLKIEGDEVRLENIDFVWEPKDASDAAGENDESALVRFSGDRADFRGCRFLTARVTRQRPAAIRWTDGELGDASAVALPNGRVQWTNCVFRRVDECLDCRRRGAIALDAKNCLALETSDLLRLGRRPELDEPISLRLARLTMQKTGSLVSMSASPSESSPGEIDVEAENCVFAPRKGVPLMAFDGVEPPAALLRNIRWSGSSSLVEVETPVAAWKPSAGQWETLDDSTLAIAGLVRSPLRFAEISDEKAGRLLDWQAPLPTADPPGADAESLPRGDAD
jgi:serine/threonine protein kinase